MHNNLKGFGHCRHCYLICSKHLSTPTVNLLENVFCLTKILSIAQISSQVATVKMMLHFWKLQKIDKQIFAIYFTIKQESKLLASKELSGRLQWKKNFNR